MISSVGLTPWSYCLHLNSHTSSWYAHKLVLPSQLPYWDAVLINSTKQAKEEPKKARFFNLMSVRVLSWSRKFQSSDVGYAFCCSLNMWSVVKAACVCVCVGGWLVGCVDETNMHRGTELAFFIILFFQVSVSPSLSLNRLGDQCDTGKHTNADTPHAPTVPPRGLSQYTSDPECLLTTPRWEYKH